VQSSTNPTHQPHPTNNIDAPSVPVPEYNDEKSRLDRIESKFVSRYGTVTRMRIFTKFDTITTLFEQAWLAAIRGDEDKRLLVHIDGHPEFRLSTIFDDDLPEIRFSNLEQGIDVIQVMAVI
jgi:hypothetical protein